MLVWLLGVSVVRGLHVLPAGLLLYEPAAEAAVPLIHDRLYALAGGAVTLRYREPGGRRPTTDDQ